MEAAPINPKKRRREQVSTFLVFVAFSVLEIGYLLFSNRPTNWIILAGAIMFPILALLALLSLIKNWTPEQEDKIFSRTLGWIVAAPIVVVVAAIAGVALYSAFGWLATIPSWAAVIIVLLVLIYLKLIAR